MESRKFEKKKKGKLLQIEMMLPSDRDLMVLCGLCSRVLDHVVGARVQHLAVCGG